MIDNDELDEIARYRGLAEDMRLRAGLARSPCAAATYLGIAADYEDMAESVAALNISKSRL